MSVQVLAAGLAARVGSENVEPGVVVRDTAGRDCGPFLQVRPANTAEVAEVLRYCASERAPVVPVGRATAYWHPLPDDAAVALDLRRLNAVEWIGQVAVAGAGAAVRPLDQALRAAGGHLALHPDAFGGTTLGALVATACTSGIGMGQTTVGELVAGVEVVSGAGDVFFTGSASHQAVPPLLREGLPDLTGLFLGAEGGIGVVTKVALRFRPPPWRVHLRGAVDPTALKRVVSLGRTLADAYDTFRLTRSLTTWNQGYVLDLWVVSSFSAQEAGVRAAEVERRLIEAGALISRRVVESPRARDGVGPDYDARWAGPIDGLAAFAARGRLRGLDVNAAYECVPDLLLAAEAMLAAQRVAGVPESRLAWYLAPDFVNLGVHATVPLDSDPWPPAVSRPWFDRFAALPVVPYRLGRAWPAGWLEGLGVTRESFRALKATFDPMGILQPGLPLWS